jgi:polygalacturonase
MIKRSLLIFGAFAARLVLACDKADTDACASVFTASAEAAITFCESYTKSAVTAITALPAFATYCSNASKKLSSACTCLLGTAASVYSFVLGSF